MQTMSYSNIISDLNSQHLQIMSIYKSTPFSEFKQRLSYNTNYLFQLIFILKERKKLYYLKKLPAVLPSRYYPIKVILLYYIFVCRRRSGTAGRKRGGGGDKYVVFRAKQHGKHSISFYILYTFPLD